MQTEEKQEIEEGSKALSTKKPKRKRNVLKDKNLLATEYKVTITLVSKYTCNKKFKQVENCKIKQKC